MPVASKGCVLTWDFDVIRGECEFLVLHTPRIISANGGLAQPHSPTLSPVEMVTAAIAGTGTAVVADASLKLGQDLVIKEKPMTCQVSRILPLPMISL